MWMNEIKTKTKSCHIQIDHTFYSSIYPTNNAIVSLKDDFNLCPQVKERQQQLSNFIMAFTAKACFTESNKNILLLLLCLSHYIFFKWFSRGWNKPLRYPYHALDNLAILASTDKAVTITIGIKLNFAICWPVRSDYVLSNVEEIIRWNSLFSAS